MSKIKEIFKKLKKLKNQYLEKYYRKIFYFDIWMNRRKGFIREKPAYRRLNEEKKFKRNKKYTHCNIR